MRFIYSIEADYYLFIVIYFTVVDSLSFCSLNRVQQKLKESAEIKSDMGDKNAALQQVAADSCLPL
jgi:hypothetical protein